MKLITALFLVALSLFLGGCMADAPIPTKVITQRVEIPVPVKPVAPPELVTCPAGWPKVNFYKPEDKRYFVALTQEDAEALREFGNRAVACIRAWRVWAQP